MREWKKGRTQEQAAAKTNLRSWTTMSKNDDFTYTTFNVGVSDRKDRATFLPATLFGKPGGV